MQYFQTLGLTPCFCGTYNSRALITPRKLDNPLALLQ